MRLYSPKQIRWLTGCLIFLAASCRQAPASDRIIETREDSLLKKEIVQRAWDSLSKLRPQLQNAYLITRIGNDFTSETFRKMNQRDQSFSHCGIISIEQDTAFVYHALGGEWNPDQKIRRDPLSVFAEPYNNKGIGIYRFDISEETAHQVVNTARMLYRKGIRFDMQFDIETDDRMYCAEFVCKTYQIGSGGTLQFEPSRIGKVAFFAVDNIYLHPQCQPLHKLVYK